MGCTTSSVVVVPLPPPRSPTPSPSPPKTPTPEPRPETPPLPPDQAEIRIDPGVDENCLASCEEDYPGPEPPKDTGKKKDVFFDDEDYQNASDFVDLFDTELGRDDVSVRQLNVEMLPDTPRPRPRPPTSMEKMSFQVVDRYASNAGAEELSSMKNLIDYLKEPWQHDRCRQVKTARAIVTWLSQQDTEGKNYGVADDSTPKGLLQYLIEGRMTYATCYTILCRAAGLQCTLIEGFVKAARHEPGDDEVPLTKWTAVYGEYGWQIVHPFWVCRALYGHNMGGWVKVEADGKAMNVQERQSDGIVRNTFQERYFMPNPEEFLYECCAKDPEWQLVQPEKKINSMNEFLAAPYLLPPLHSVGLQLVNQRSCVLQSKAGFCKVEFKGRSTDAHMLLLRYELFKKNTDGTTLDKFDASRMVFNSRSNEHFIFDIRFLLNGVYKLVIYGGPYKSAALRLCEFRIDCDEGMQDHDLLPLSCNKIGWGPGPAAITAGLLMPTKPSGLIAVERSGPKKLETEIKFRIRDDFIAKHEYSVEVHGRRGDGSGQIVGSDFIARKGQVSETQNVSFSITMELEFVVRVKLPNEGEFGITIHERETSSVENKTTTVCNYLATTLAYSVPRIRTEVKLAKQRLFKVCTEVVENAQLQTKIESIEAEIAKCTNLKIADDDEDICAAELTKEYLKCKKLLRDTLLREHYGYTCKTLNIMSRYKYRIVLRKEILRVEKLQIELLQRQDEERGRRDQS